MERTEIINKLTPIVRTCFQNEALILSDDMSSENVSTWTSLAFMQMLTEIENEFEIRFKMMELIHFRTMGDIINSLENHLANA